MLTPVYVYLVLRVCLVTDPFNTCRVVEIPTDANSVVACQMGVAAQMPMAQWIEAHPKWAIEKWHCESGVRT